jgi:hypothetical protein
MKNMWKVVLAWTMVACGANERSLPLDAGVDATSDAFAAADVATGTSDAHISPDALVTDDALSAADAAPGTSDAHISPDALTTDDAAPGTPDAHVSPDALATADAVPLACSWVSLLSNGSFDDGPSVGWSGNTVLITKYTTDPLSSHYAPTTPHSGLYELAFYDGGEITQNVVIPATATALRLSGYRYQWYCATDLGGDAYVIVNNPTTGSRYIDIDFGYVGFESDPWTEFSSDGVGDFAGRSVTVDIEAGFVCMSFDDLVLEAYVCS